MLRAHAVLMIADPSVWKIMDGEIQRGIFLTYVDYCVVVGKFGVTREIISGISRIWDIKRTGTVKSTEVSSLEFPGVTIERGKDGALYCHQRPYIVELLERWGMTFASPAKLTSDLYTL